MMRILKNFSIQKKLYGGFGVVLLLLAAVATISYAYLIQVNDSYRDLINEKAASVQLIQDLDIAVEQQNSNLYSYVLSGDENNLALYKEARSTFGQTMDQLQAMITDRSDKQLLAGLDLLQAQFSSTALRIIDAKKQSDSEAIVDLSTKQAPVLKAFTSNAQRFVKEQQEQLTKSVQETETRVNQIRLLVAICTLIALVIGAAASYLISESISKPVKTLHRMANRIAEGQLRDTSVEVKSRDEIGQLGLAFNLMAHNLRELIHEVGSNAERVAASSEELTASADQTGLATEHVASIMEGLAEGAEKQVASIEDSVKLVHHMNEEAGMIANRAKIVTQSAEYASVLSSEGSIAVQSAITQMGSVQTTVAGVMQTVTVLGEKTKEIDAIITIIHEIARQTNLLSLNAAIEAARAGEHGRGFSVVAGEVRKLAEQTAESSKRVADAIRTIQEETQRTIVMVKAGEGEVHQGIDAVTQAGHAFQEIEQSILEVNRQIQEVTSYSAKMSGETSDLVSRFEIIDQNTHTTSEATHTVSASAEEQLASVEQITASSKELASLAEKLQESIEKFTV